MLQDDIKNYLDITTTVQQNDLALTHSNKQTKASSKQLNQAHNLSNKASKKKLTFANTFLGGCAIACFIGGRKEVVNYFKVHNFSHNPHLFNLHLSLALIITLATIRTLASTVIKVQYIQYNSEKEDKKNEKSSAFARFVVWMNGFIAATAIFVPTFNTFQSFGMVICGIMAIYAISSSIYSSIKYAKPLIGRVADWFFQMLFNREKRKDACQKLATIFFSTKERKFKFFITTVGTLTSSLFFFYGLHTTFQLALIFPFSYFLHATPPDYFWLISGGLAIFCIIWVLIPGYALTFREEASEFIKKKSNPSKKPTPSREDLQNRRRCDSKDNFYISSSILLYFFTGIGVICWLTCSLVLSVGTYIGAQHIFGNFACCTMISDFIFVIDFLYQLNYYGTELYRKISNTLINHMPCAHYFFKTEEEREKEKNTTSVNTANH